MQFKLTEVFYVYFAMYSSSIAIFEIKYILSDSLLDGKGSLSHDG